MLLGMYHQISTLSSIYIQIETPYTYRFVPNIGSFREIDCHGHFQFLRIAVGVVDIDFAVRVVRAVQPVEVCHAVCDAFRVFIHNVHAIVYEILCTAADVS